jgi:hypothetical protein
MIWRIREVVNYGGFFAGDTVTVTAYAIGKPDDELTVTIDQDALSNVDGRFHIVAGMALDVQLEGDHIVAAALLAAPNRAALRTAVRQEGPQVPTPKAISANSKSQIPDSNVLLGPRIFSHYCAKCALWILGAPRDGRCGVEGHAL